MSAHDLLWVETSERRIQRAHGEADKALRAAGRPYHRWAIVVQDSPAESVAKACPREEVVRQALASAEKPGKAPELSANLREVAQKIQTSPREVAEVIFFSEGGAELHFIAFD